MLYLLIGTDKKKINSFLEKENGEAPIQRIDSFSWDADLLRSLIESNSLFGGDDETVVLEGISEDEEAFEHLINFAQGIVESNKKFFLIEGDITEEILEIFEGKKALVSDFREDKKDAWKGKYHSEKFNPFALADAVGRRSPKEAWIEYERARIAGAEPEELHARAWGKVRDMISSEKATADELGIHPFVHKKAKADLKNWPPHILQKFTDNLLGVYHKSRMGGDELDIALEKLFLNI